MSSLPLIIKKLCTNFLYAQNRVIDHRLLKKEKGSYHRNERFALALETVLFDQKCSVNDDMKLLFSNKIVINTQCLYDNNQIDGDQDLNALQHLYDVLGDNNKDVVIKPHPRETSIKRYERFGWKVIDNISITQEELFAKLKDKPKMIVGIYSSTLINLKALFGIETISLVEFYKNESIPEDEKRTCKNFINEFGRFVQCPKSDEELHEILDRIIDND